MKKVMVYLLMVALLVSVSVSAAQAEIRAEVVHERAAYPIYELYELYGIMIRGSKDGYVLTDIFGNPISESYAYIHTVPSGLPFFEANMGTDPINDSVVLDLQGNVISEDRYGRIYYLSEKWYVGLVLEPVTDGTDEFGIVGGPDCGIQRADLYYQGNRVASLNREKYGSPTAHGDYLYMSYDMIQERGIDGVYDLNGTFSEKEVSLIGSGVEYEWVLSEQCMYHIGTGQRAFTPGCTLRKEEVKDCLLYDGQGNVLDLQGNVVLFLPEKPKVSFPQKLTLYGGRYFVINAAVAEGDYLCDLEKGILYNAQEFYGVETMAQTGYVLCKSDDNVFSYVNVSGEVTAQGFVTTALPRRHSLFQWKENNETGKYTIFTALEGQLKEEYDNVYIGLYSSAKIVAVKKDGKWGAIDLHGNTVIDFVHKTLYVCSDTSYAIGQVMDTNKLTLYKLIDVDLEREAAAAAEEARIIEEMQRAEEEARLAEEAIRQAEEEARRAEEEARLAEEAARQEAESKWWHCDACNRDNDMNFCPGCGAKKPVKLVCSGCGYEPEAQDFRFCPQCGQSFN